jgi:hypothetical protein
MDLAAPPSTHPIKIGNEDPCYIIIVLQPYWKFSVKRVKDLTGAKALPWLVAQRL